MRHPDQIPDLAPDCRRVLRDEYQAIQVATQPVSHHKDLRGLSPAEARAKHREKIAAAVTEYKRVAAMWGVTP